LIVPASLVLLVAILATLQYRWLGQVSEAERDRRQKSLAQRSSEFADDFDREILRLYLALQVDGTAIDRGDFAGFAHSYDGWRESARFPEMLRAVYLTDGSAPAAAPRKYDADTQTFVAVTWPVSLAPVTERLTQATATTAGGGPVMVNGVRSVPPPPPPPPPGVITPDGSGKNVMTNAAGMVEQLRHVVAARDPIVASVPAILVSLPRYTGTVTGVNSTWRIDHQYLVAELDEPTITGTILPALAERYFPERDADSYRFDVIDTSDSNRVVYARGLANNAIIDARHADASVPLFSVRLDLTSQVANRFWLSQTSGASAGPVGGRGGRGAAAGGINSSSVSIFVESHGTSTSDVVKVNASSAAWQLRFQHSAGSLDAAVGAARRRNLWLSFGILSVLAASVVLIVVSAERWQRLAAQQMDFVATVTHELRTPLTVIRSAAQNLSAGVVHDSAQARQYGDLIETEGRRLTDMVEQVLEYAGMSGTWRTHSAKPVDVSELVQDVVASASSMADAANIEFAIEAPDDLPPVAGDEGALRRALQNLIGNAVKYGGDGGWIGVTARRALARGGDEMHISVSDRGRGIDADDLAHIFEPFYRGRYAIERQIHGNGLGLSLVKRIAEAHGGHVTVTSEAGTGTTFTITLPAPLRTERQKRGWTRSDSPDPVHPAAESGGTLH
jgi:signal transduction histidine kinase